MKLFYSILINIFMLGCGLEPTNDQDILNNNQSTVSIFEGYIDTIKIKRSTPIRVDRNEIQFLESMDEEVKSIRIDGPKDYIKVDCTAGGMGADRFNLRTNRDDLEIRRVNTSGSWNEWGTKVQPIAHPEIDFLGTYDTGVERYVLGGEVESELSYKFTILEDSFEEEMTCNYRFL